MYLSEPIYFIHFNMKHPVFHIMKRGLISFWFFFEISVIVQGGKNMLGELAMDNLVIMSAFDNLMKVLEILQKEGINCL